MKDYNRSLYENFSFQDFQCNYSLTLEKEHTRLLLYKSNLTFNTQINDLLLTALSYALFDLNGSIVNHITLEGHGRENINEQVDVSRTLGWFTSMYPVRLEVHDNIEETLKITKDLLRRIPNKGLGFYVLNESTNQNLPGIYFNYLGQFNTVDSFSENAKQSWMIIDEFSGITTSPMNKSNHIISINGGIFDHELRLIIQSKIEKEKISNFIQSFKKNLKLIIDNTANYTRTFLTCSDVGDFIEKEDLEKLQVFEDIESICIANSLQQGFVYHFLSKGYEDDSYRIQCTWSYCRDIDIKMLKESWQLIQKKYPVLRRGLNWEKEIIQIV